MMAEIGLGLILVPVLFVAVVAIDRYFGDW